MDESEVKERAFAMPLTSPAFPPGPYRKVEISTAGLLIEGHQGKGH